VQFRNVTLLRKTKQSPVKPGRFNLALAYNHNYAQMESHAKPDTLLLALDVLREG